MRFKLGQVKKEHFGYDEASLLIEEAQSRILSNKSKKYAMVSYGIMIAFFISLRDSNYNGVESICENAIGSINAKEDIRKYIVAVSLIMGLLNKDFVEVSVYVDENGTVSINDVN